MSDIAGNRICRQRRRTYKAYGAGKAETIGFDRNDQPLPEGEQHRASFVRPLQGRERFLHLILGLHSLRSLILGYYLGPRWGQTSSKLSAFNCRNKNVVQRRLDPFEFGNDRTAFDQPS